ncbi:glycohydrolase toxin TNT-related protein [Spirillospora sp. NPDC029432]|uniref:glycohydrolase toxin TNT-related protein n=1 Tax=Spirillospora sp. NPDC029432 TaxID=3154599 RepID=UPI00345250DC
MALNDDPGRVLPAPAAVPSPVDERAAVARLAPESPLLFPWARRALRDIAGSGAARFLVGRTLPGCWSVLPGEGEWLTVHEPGGPGEPEGGAPSTAVAHRTARAAVADAAAGVLAAAGVRLTSGILELATIIMRDPRDGRPFWKPGAAGGEIKARGGGPSGPRAAGPGVAIDFLEGRPLGYFACAPGPPPERGAYATVHEIFELAVLNLLPPDPEDGSAEGVDLPEGTELDGFGDQGQVFLFTPETPFGRRGLWGAPARHEHRAYRVRRPLRAYPGFPVAGAVSPAPAIGKPAEGQGYYLVDTVADLVRAGDLAEISASRRGAA